MSRMRSLYVATGVAVAGVLLLLCLALLRHCMREPASVWDLDEAGAQALPAAAESLDARSAAVRGARPVAADHAGSRDQARFPQNREPTRPLESGHDPAWHAPIDLVLPELRARAEAGEADAQFALGVRLAQCREPALQQLRGFVALERDSMHREAKGDDRDRMQQRRIHASRQRIEDYEAILAACERIGPGIASEWLDWIERAAVAGSAAARVQYWNYVADHYTDAASVIRDADNAVRRRGLARAWLAAELARGNREALRMLAQEAGHVLGYPPAQNAAWLWALREVEIAHGVDAQRIRYLEQRWAEATSTLDPAAVAAAQREGERIQRACCAPRG